MISMIMIGKSILIQKRLHDDLQSSDGQSLVFVMQTISRDFPIAQIKSISLWKKRDLQHLMVLSV